MRVSGLDNDLDWRFGKGRAVYKRNADAIAQNILTRLRSFLGDWYLDTEIGIDWLKLLGNLGTEKRILRSVESTVMQTEGVLSIQELKNRWTRQRPRCYNPHQIYRCVRRV